MTMRSMWGLIAAALFAAGVAVPAQADPFPKAVAGWARGDEVRTFSAANLFEYIDGDAEKYLKVGVKSAMTADYSLPNKTDAVADVYTMSDANGAKAIFESEAAGDAKTVALGDAGRLYSQSVVFRKGVYLVRLVAYQAGAEVPQALTDLGRAIEQQLGK